MFEETKVKDLTINTFPSKEVYEKAKKEGLLKDGEIHLYGGDDTYEELKGLPSINGVTVKGEMESKDLGLQAATTELSTTEILDIWNKVMND